MSRAIRRYRVLGVVLLMLGLAATALVALGQRPLYTAESLLRLENRQPKLAEMLSATDSLLSGGLSDTSVVRSEVELLRSPHLIRRIVMELGLANRDAEADEPGVSARVWAAVRGLLAAPDQDAAVAPRDPPRMERVIDDIASRLHVEAVGNSYLVRIAYRDHDPQVAAAFVNRLVQIYVGGQREAKEKIAAQEHARLGKELEEMRKALIESERGAAAFRDDSKLSEVKGVTLLGQQLTEATQALAAANTKVQQLQAEITDMRRGGSLQDRMSTSRFLDSPIVQRLLTEEAALNHEEAEKSNSYGPQHPAIADLRARRAALQGRIRREAGSIALAAERSLTVAKAEAAALQERVDDLTRRQGELSGASATLRDLEQVATANRTMYNDLLNKYRLADARQHHQDADVSVLAEAKEPEVGRSGRLLILAGGVAGSATLSLAAMLLTHWRRGGLIDLRDLSRRTGVRSLGMLPEVGSRDRKRFLAGHNTVNTALVDAALGIFHALSNTERTRPVRSIMVTSAVPEEGKTFTAIVLARVLALSGYRTLLVDLDCRCPSVEKAVEADIVHRTVVTLEGSSSGREFVQASSRLQSDEVPMLEYLFTKGQGQGILSARDLHRLTQSVQQDFDIVIIDSPPALATSEALAIGRHADYALLAARWEHTAPPMIEETLATLQGAGVDIEGIIMTRVDYAKHARYRLHDSATVVKKYTRKYQLPSAVSFGR